ncbi:hypothetical protein B0H16DRAFT_1733906 [Mycena metata]|uniref:Uncharacterized protein n=1 Tax=Mycena metata TaxID=1033252 RepID=A0AAD7HYF4_9AGAR|nr:hypothetical protein B0H16DRAFT_1733906 [Mycena metata]
MNNCQPIIQFIRTLRVLPTLRSLTILGVHSRMADIFTTSLEDFSFPSVSRLTLDDYLAPIIPCFPNIRILSVLDDAPNLSSLSVWHVLCGESNRMGSFERTTRSLQSLSKLSRLLVYCYLEGSTATDGDIGGQVDEIVAVGKQLLQTSKGSCGPKELRIHYFKTLKKPDHTHEQILATELLFTIAHSDGEWTAALYNFPLQLSDYELKNLYG